MAPRNETNNETRKEEVEPDVPSIPSDIPAKQPPLQIVWRNVILFLILHIGSLYGLACLPSIRPLTWVWLMFIWQCNNLGVTAGAHRLWSHRSYKARLPLRILLAVFNTMAFQNDIIEWARDHRVHHKYSETDADPHNAKRGFFFSHVGWLLCRKHPEVKDKGRQIDIADIENDPVCKIQRKIYLPAVVLMCFVVPTIVPWYFWGEKLSTAFYVCASLRYTVNLHVTWLVNSAAHMWGNKPFDRHINPSQNTFVAVVASGEGFHNYHHTFPQDYSTSEWGWKINATTMFIDFMSYIGLAYDRKKMSAEAIMKKKSRSGDGTEGFGYFQNKKVN